MYGTAWRKEDGSGKTFYIGKKKNARFVRVYEKGRQLGDKDSVSTHSRPKAAGKSQMPCAANTSSFNSQPPEGGWR